MGKHDLGRRRQPNPGDRPNANSTRQIDCPIGSGYAPAFGRGLVLIGVEVLIAEAITDDPSELRIVRKVSVTFPSASLVGDSAFLGSPWMRTAVTATGLPRPTLHLPDGSGRAFGPGFSSSLKVRESLADFSGIEGLSDFFGFCNGPT